MSRTIGVIGCGTVGRAVARTYTEFADVRVYDVDPRKATHAIEQTARADVCFVCLPTPAKKGGGLCLEAINLFAEWAGKNRKNGNYCLRSTVPVGTTTWLREYYGLVNLVHSPEFLTARCALADSLVPGRNVVGGPACPGKTAAEALYRDRFPGVPVHSMTAEESEFVKLMTNGFFAVKVAYFNEVRAYCDAARLDWDRVLAAVLADGRIAHSHTKVPGPDGLYGFGGTCLPKDLGQLIKTLDDARQHAAVTVTADFRNRVYDRPRPTAPEA